jgi:hypothetical protein
MQTGLVQAVWRALKAVKKIHAAVPEEDRKKMQACIPPPSPHLCSGQCVVAVLVRTTLQRWTE